MANFELNDRWDVDKKADKLNSSLFGSDKKRKKKQSSLFSPRKSKGSSAIIHDSDDEQYTKKGKRKLKKKNRKLKKQQPDTGEAGHSSFDMDVSHDSEHVNGHGENESRKKKKRKRDSGDIGRKATKKRKLHLEEVDKGEDHSPSKKHKRMEILKNDESQAHEDLEEKKKRKRKKKNNPLKNKYRHLALQAKEESKLKDNDRVSPSKGRINVNKSNKTEQLEHVSKIIGSTPQSPEASNSKRSKLHQKKLKQKSSEVLKEEKILTHSSIPKNKELLKAALGVQSDAMENPQKVRRNEVKLGKFEKKTKKATTPEAGGSKAGKRNKIDERKSKDKKEEKGGGGPTKLNKDILRKMLRESDVSLTKKKIAKRNLVETDNDRPNPQDKKKKKAKSMTGSDSVSGNTPSTPPETKTSSFTPLWGRAAGLAEQARETLNSARFRYLNEQLYTCSGLEARGLFQKDREAFQVYHEGYQGQVAKWEVNPLDIITRQIKNKPTSLVIADLGCGEGQLGQSLPQKVHSFDLVALNKHVTACDMSKVPLPSEKVDIAVFCLSLMGTNLSDYICEANRVLKPGGLLKIAEVVSRFSGLSSFISAVCSLGFALLNKRDLSQMFYLLDFKKVKAVKKSPSNPTIKLKPCIYKRR